MDDLISRQAAIDKINERQRKLIYCFGFENDMVKIMDIAKSIVITIPSAQPGRKKGKWVNCYTDGFRNMCKCSECGARIDIQEKFRSFFCYHCGADMRKDDNG